MRLFVDIDGILTIDSIGFGDEVYRNRQPNWNTITILQELVRRGHRVTLFTSRWREDEKVTKKWLAEHGVPYHSLIFNKPKYDVFLDDLATNSLGEFVQMIIKAEGK